LPKNTRVFEEFFVIGVEKEKDLISADLDWTHSDKQFIPPKTLYLYNKDL
jgi:hypothetical protein